MADYATEQNIGLAKKMLEQQGEINRLKATVERVRDDAEKQRRETGTTHDRWKLGVYAQACRTLRILNAALDAPEPPEMRPVSVESPGSKVPDRIDFDSNGDLDDVVVNDCMAHLERLDTGLWYLGLYGNDGRIVQIDIASKTGRAGVTGLVKYSKGIAPDLDRWAKPAPETPGDAG